MFEWLVTTDLSTERSASPFCYIGRGDCTNSKAASPSVPRSCILDVCDTASQTRARCLPGSTPCKLLISLPSSLSALRPAVAPGCLPQAGAPHVPEAGASSAAAGFQCPRLHDIEAAGEAA